MIRAFTVFADQVDAGIKTGEGMIFVGEEGRGRTLTKAPLPPKAVVEDGMFVSYPGEGYVILLLESCAGFRGSCSFDLPQGATEIALGRKAQGDAGAMGGGPEILCKVPFGTIVKVHRSGRRVEVKKIAIDISPTGEVTSRDIEAEERQAIAASSW